MDPINATGMAGIFRRARAKINLDLLITGQRDDGYHLLDSLVVFADYGDEITVTLSEKLELEITGPFGQNLAQNLSGEKDNIILEAARLIQEKFDVAMGAKITLVKNLPVSSGIGGGSADAAATIEALMELWWVDDLKSQLGDLPLTLGADVPVCLKSQTEHMTGIGENLKPVALNFPLFMLLVNPGFSVSTRDIFTARAARQPGYSLSRHLPDEISSFSQLTNILMTSGNDLQFDACEQLPEIQAVLDSVAKLPGVDYASMSGSGATCFGLFDSLEAVDEASEKLSGDFPEWWVQPVQIR